ncbi:MAG TPA: carbon storage regulator [Tepidisphaeraceae bacterium]|nr:carbon storage regulator [Tepidisphaeraceae bacterium]
MLVLSRQRDQTIVINDNIEITVVDIRGDKVRLGFTAPKEISIIRKELGKMSRKQSSESAAPAATAASGPDPFLLAAIEEAQLGLKEGGLPIGSVLVRNGQIVARGHNRRVQHGDPMAHAEIDCLTKAGRQKTYKDTVLYSTLMPCYLCSGAVVQFGVPKVIVGESVNFKGGPDFMRQHGVEVIDLADPACIEMMGNFITAHPELWNEDIGK